MIAITESELTVEPDMLNASKSQSRRSTIGQGVRAGLGKAIGTSAMTASASHPQRVGIREIRLQTRDLKPVGKFYRQDLGMPTKRQGNELTVTAGATHIAFETGSSSESAPCYHFAFNIPENKLEAVRQWHKASPPC